MLLVGIEAEQTGVSVISRNTGMTALLSNKTCLCGTCRIQQLWRINAGRTSESSPGVAIFPPSEVLLHRSYPTCNRQQSWVEMGKTLTRWSRCSGCRKSAAWRSGLWICGSSLRGRSFASAHLYERTCWRRPRWATRLNSHQPCPPVDKPVPMLTLLFFFFVFFFFYFLLFISRGPSRRRPSFWEAAERRCTPDTLSFPTEGCPCLLTPLAGLLHWQLWANSKPAVVTQVLHPVRPSQ